MRKILKGILFAVALLTTLGIGNQIVKAEKVYINEENFPDKELRKAIIHATLPEGIICDEQDRWYIDTDKCTRLEISVGGVKNFAGLEKINKLEELYLEGYPYDSFDASFMGTRKNLELKFDYWERENKVSITLGALSKVEELSLIGVKVNLDTNTMDNIREIRIEESEGEITVGANIALERVCLSDCDFSELDLSAASTLSELLIDYCNYKNLSFPKNNNIERLEWCDKNATEIDLSQFKELNDAVLDLPKVKSADFSVCSNLGRLYLISGIVDLDLSKCDNLSDIYVTLSKSKPVSLKLNKERIEYVYIDAGKYLKEIDLSGSSKLKELTVCGSKLNTVILSDCNKLTKLNVHDCPKLKTIDLKGLKGLSKVDIRNSNIKSIDFSQCPKLKKLYFDHKVTKSIKFCDNGKLKKLYITAYNNINKIDLSKIIGVGGKVIKKDPCMKYNAKSAILTIKGNEWRMASCTIKKGKTKYKIIAELGF